MREDDWGGGGLLSTLQAIFVCFRGLTAAAPTWDDRMNDAEVVGRQKGLCLISAAMGAVMVTRAC